MKKTRYDVWMANLGPSEQLLKIFRAGEISWQAFSRFYKEEMREEPPLDRNNQNIKNHGQKFTFRLIQKLASRGPVTLMCHCDGDEPECHLRLLERMIESV